MNRRLPYTLAAATAAMLLALAGCATTPGSSARSQAAARGLVHDVALAMDTIVDDGDRPELRVALRDACALLVFPHLRGGGFLAGGAGGTGLLMVREPDRAHWGGPAFFSLDDASIGLEVNLSTRQLIVVFQRCNALQQLQQRGQAFSFRMRLAGESAEDDSGLIVEPGIRVFSRTAGAAVGASLHFVELQANGELTAACYGRALTPAQALEGDLQGDEGVAALRRATERATR